MTKITRKHYHKWIKDYMDIDDLMLVLIQHTDGKEVLLDKIEEILLRDEEYLHDIATDLDDTEFVVEELLKWDTEALVNAIIKAFDYKTKDEMIEQLKEELDIDQEEEVDWDSCWCAKCQTTIEEDYNFCPNCGAKLSPDGEY